MAPVRSWPSDEASGPLIELVPYKAHQGAPEAQQTLFSWAEFMAEQPEELKPRGRNSRPSGPPLFDWALEQEQQAGLTASAE